MKDDKKTASPKTKIRTVTATEVDCAVHVGSGNVFADTGLPNPEELQAKALISIRIEQLIKHSALKQSEAANLTGLTQPEVSLIMRGRLKGFSLDRLIQCVQALGQDVRIVLPVTLEQRDRPGHMEVTYEDVPVLLSGSNSSEDSAHIASEHPKRKKKGSDRVVVMVA